MLTLISLFWAFSLQKVAFAQSGEILSFQHIQGGKHSFTSNEYRFGIPPISSDRIMLLNNFRVSDAKDNSTDYRQFRWSPGILYRPPEGESFFLSSPLTYSSVGSDHLMSKDALDWTIILSSGRRKLEPGRINWSYGLLGIDLSKRSRFFPIFGFGYLSQNSNWRTSFGYPAFALTYLGITNFEYSLFFSRELNRYKIHDQHNFKTNGEFVEINLNKIGISIHHNFNPYLKASISYSQAFNSESKFLDASHTANGNNHLDYSDAGFLQISLGVGFNRSQ